MPKIMQGFVAKPEETEKGIDFDRRLYVVRREFEQSTTETYVVSLSSRTIVYKGMFLVGQLRTFFPDLQIPSIGRRLPLCTPGSVPTRSQAGRELIRTGLSYTMERSIPFRAM